jgi:Big-like domain-containing protein/fibronectin type III domain protein
MKFQSTISLLNGCLPTQNSRAAMFQLGKIAQSFFQNVVQHSTESISRLTFFKSLPKFSFCILFVALTTVIPCDPVFSANVSVTWNKNTESDLAGYKIYKRTLPSQDFGQPIFSGMPSNPSSPSTTVSGLTEGTTYGFIATAFDKSGNESAPSTEKQISVPTGTPPPPSSLSISNLTVASGQTYVVPTSSLQAGGTVYIDRAYTFTTVPALVQGAAYIQTANNDKAATNAAFLSFTVNQSVSVYVAYDMGITPKPSWLSTFTDTGANLVTTDKPLRLFVRSFPAGTITLGGNAGSGASMYSVVVKPDGGTTADTTAPTVTLTAPSAGIISGTVTVTASASDNIGVTGVQFRLQGANLGAEDTTNPYSTSWNTTTVPNGSYTLTAIARDAAGNTTTSTARTVTVSNTTTPPPPPADTTPPTVTLTAPSAGTISGTVTVTASASDNVGVTGVQFRLQGANLGAEDTSNPYSTSWNTTTTPNGSYTLTAIARDAAGNTKTSAPITVTVSNTSTPPPSSLTISNLTVASGQSYLVPTSGLQAGGTVYIDRAYTFTTVPSSVQGAAYIRTANNDKSATTSTFLTFTVNQPVSVSVAHDVRLTPKPSWLTSFTDTGTNLVTSDTTLRLFVRSFPAGTITLGGNAGSGGSMYSVVVKPDGGTPADTTAPTVTLTAPSTGTISGTVTVSASASDNVGVTGVQFRLQGTNLGAEDTTNPYSTSWNTTTVPNGSYTLTAIARDAAGNTKTSAPITVTVSNISTPPADTTAPTVSLTAPSAGTISGTVTVSASASDNVGVAGVQFRLQGANLGAEDTTNPYSTSWNTTTVPNGSYTLTAIARDAAGNTTTAAPRTVTVSNSSTPPPPSAATVQVNFQPATATVPSGYQKDDGSVYTSSRGYGWTNGGTTMRERNTNSDQRLDTFIQLKPEEGNTWRYDMPNGNYTISLVSGDPDYALSPQRITVEGKVVIDNLSTSTPNTFLTITDVPITIADGTLTITLGPSTSNSKLNYVQVKPSNPQ